MDIDDIDLNLYKTFYITARAKSFSKAAHELFVSQPAVSHAIKVLENQLNCRLFNRNNKNISLTFEGEQIFNNIETAYNLLMSAKIRLNEIKNLEYGHVSLGAPSHIANAFLIPLMKDFSKTNPQISFSILNSSTGQLLKALNNRKIELMVDTSPILSDSTRNIIVIKKLSTCFAFNSTYPIDTKEVWEERDFIGHKLILPIADTNIRNLINELFSKKNIVLQPYVEAGTTDILLNAVKNNLGIGFFITETVEDDIKKGILKPIKTSFEMPIIDLCILYYKNNLSIASEKFLQSYILKK